MHFTTNCSLLIVMSPSRNRRTISFSSVIIRLNTMRLTCCISSTSSLQGIFLVEELGCILTLISIRNFEERPSLSPDRRASVYRKQTVWKTRGCKGKPNTLITAIRMHSIEIQLNHFLTQNSTVSFPNANIFVSRIMFLSMLHRYLCQQSSPFSGTNSHKSFKY